jgi:hypothetical protein
VSPIPTEEEFLAAIHGKLNPAIRDLIAGWLAGLPEEQRADAMALIDAKFFSVVEANLIPGFVLGLKGALTELFATGHGPTGSSPGHHAGV